MHRCWHLYSFLTICIKIWGFAVIGNERKHVRTIRFENTEGQKVIEAVLVYDFSKCCVFARSTRLDLNLSAEGEV